MKWQYYILFPIIMLLNACSGQYFKQANEAPKLIISEKSQRNYDNFWDYVQNFEEIIPPEYLLKQDYYRFSCGMSLIYMKDFDSASYVFENIYQSTNDSLTRVNSKKILVDLLFFNSKWNELTLLDTNETLVNSVENSLRLATAFSKVKPQRIQFPKDKLHVPIYLSPTGCPIIELMLNGQKRFFWIDTGANYSVISSDIALESAIEPLSDEKTKALTGTTIKVDIYPALLDTVRIGDLSIFNHPAIIVQDFDLKFKFFGGGGRITKIDGILGWKFIQNFDISIDFIKAIIEIEAPKIIPNPKPNLFWLGCPVIRVKNNEGTELLFGLDLGSERTTITSNIFNKVEFEKIYSSTKRLGSAGGWIFNNSRMISSLNLDFDGELVRFEDIGTGYQLKRLFVRLDGILGTDFMRMGKVRINCPGQQFSFEFVD